MAFLVAALLLSSTGATAKSGAYDLAAELMSPYCPGRTLSSCPSPQAAELVQWMVLQEAAGSSREEIIDVLIERFGEEILGAPKAEGIGLWAYILPVLGFVVGGGLVLLALRRIVAGTGGEPISSADSSSRSATSSASPASNAPQHAITDDELARLVDQDLAARG